MGSTPDDRSWLSKTGDELSERVAEILRVPRVEALGGGHQSQVFQAVRPEGDIVIAKLLDGSAVDRQVVKTRATMISALAELDRRVCRPIPINGALVTEIPVQQDEVDFLICYEFAEGPHPDPAASADAQLMGSVLAELHDSMRKLPSIDLPFVVESRGESFLDLAGIGGYEPHQLLHGDFQSGNLVKSHGSLRVFDLEDCGCGPPAFDVANSLYMVLFDATVQSAPETYRTFRRSFVSGYVDVSGRPLNKDLLDSLIELRVGWVRTWLDDLDAAPIGIRTASPGWLATLRSFVETHSSTARPAN